MTDYLLGIDNGGTLSKVVIFDTQGNEIQVSSRKVEAEYPHAGWAERNMDGVWQSTAEAIQDALAKSGIAPQDIVAIGNTGHGNGIYLLDKQGDPLRPAVLSVDTRAERIVAEWKAQGIGARIWPDTFQNLWSGQPPVLLAWMQQHEPEQYQEIGSILLCKDYIKYCLTGELSTDLTDISATAIFDINGRRYDENLLDVFDLRELLPALPPAAESTDIIGHVTPAAAAATGLAAGTPVVGGMFDVIACALGAGVIHAGQACVISGTWSINEVVTTELVDDRSLFMSSIYTPGSYMTIESSATSASNLEWFVHQFCSEEKAEAEARGISVYEICNEIVANTPSTNIMFHPYLFGSNVQPTARAGFYGIGGWHTKAHMLRAVYEGVVYGHLRHINTLRNAHLTLESVRFTGGGARSKVWTQMFADAIELPMELVKGEEIGARGAAMCAGVGAGVYRDYNHAISEAVQVKQRFEPNPQATPYYLERYQEHQNLVAVMQEAWERLNKLNQPTHERNE